MFGTHSHYAEAWEGPDFAYYHKANDLLARLSSSYHDLIDPPSTDVTPTQRHRHAAYGSLYDVMTIGICSRCQDVRRGMFRRSASRALLCWCSLRSMEGKAGGSLRHEPLRAVRSHDGGCAVICSEEGAVIGRVQYHISDCDDDLCTLSPKCKMFGPRPDSAKGGRQGDPDPDPEPHCPFR